MPESTRGSLPFFSINNLKICPSFSFLKISKTISQSKLSTIGFANSTCFDKNLMDSIARKAEKMEKGSYFITFTKSLPSEEWVILESKVYKMSWGNATVFIQRKKKEIKKPKSSKKITAKKGKSNKTNKKKSVKKPR